MQQGHSVQIVRSYSYQPRLVRLVRLDEEMAVMQAGANEDLHSQSWAPQVSPSCW